MRHTKGPWAANGRAIEADDERGQTSVIASVYDESDLGDDRVNGEANARLIAAAPLLLEALRETHAAMRALRALAFTGSRITTERYPEKIAADAADITALAAIAAAEGK
jgi:hypothetical protein